MPINITEGVVTTAHEPERLQINLKTAHGNVQEMNIEVFFEKITIVDGKEEARVWDGTPLIFNCKEDPGLEAAMLLIQDRIDVKRYQQITPENPTP